MIGLEDNEGENTCIPSAQAEVLKNLYLTIILEDDERTAATPTIPTVIIAMSQFSTPVSHRKLSSLDILKELVLMSFAHGR